MSSCLPGKSCIFPFIVFGLSQTVTISDAKNQLRQRFYNREMGSVKLGWALETNLYNSKYITVSEREWPLQFILWLFCHPIYTFWLFIRFHTVFCRQQALLKITVKKMCPWFTDFDLWECLKISKEKSHSSSTLDNKSCFVCNERFSYH